MSVIRTNRIVLLIWFVSVVLFYFQDRYAIPNVDDWAYTMVVGDNDSNGYLSDTPIRQSVKSFADAFSSQQKEYLNTNGRFIIHTLVQYFCGTMSRTQFSFLNTFIFSIFLLLMILMVGRQFDVWLLLTFVSTLWLLLPQQGYVIMGPISLCVSYFWVAVATLLFLLLIHRVSRQCVGVKTLAIIVLYSIVAGSLQESYSIGICGALLLWVIMKWNQLNHQVLIVVLAYIAGSLICILSPANFQRATTSEGFGLHINALYGLVSSLIILLLIIIISIKVFRNQLKAFLDRHFILLVSLTISSFFSVFVAYTARHQLTMINIFAFIIVFTLWSDFVAKRKLLKRVVALVMTVLAIVLYCNVLPIRQSLHDAYYSFEQRCKSSKDGIVNGGDFEHIADKWLFNRLYNNYATIFTFMGWDYGKRMLSMCLTEGRSNHLITTILPTSVKKITESCISSNQVMPSLYLLDNGYYVYKSTRCLKKEKVRLVGQRTLGFVFQSVNDGIFCSQESFCHNGCYYYLFDNTPTFISVEKVMVE